LYNIFGQQAVNKVALGRECHLDIAIKITGLKKNQKTRFLKVSIHLSNDK
jgi:hypothetical protein